MDWYVYVGKYGDRVVYIGKGRGTRYNHLNSGISSCYAANKTHFDGGVIEVDVVSYFESSQEALEYEKKLIVELEPDWNVVFSKTEQAMLKRKHIKSVGRRKKSNSRSNFMGVAYIPEGVGGKRTEKKHWRARLKYEGRYIHIGNYVREIDAAIARDLYVINNELKGFILNFPDKNYSEILDEYVEWD